jgi:hypothetical protein
MVSAGGPWRDRVKLPSEPPIANPRYTQNMPFRRFANADVKAVFAAFAPDIRKPLMDLRQTIFDVAAVTPGVGRLEECLKWSEPAYLTTETGSGSTIRINQDKKRPGGYAIHFNCNSSLVEQFRETYPITFGYAGNRSILLHIDTKPPARELAHCIAMALTYHLAKRAKAPPIIAGS